MKSNNCRRTILYIVILVCILLLLGNFASSTFGQDHAKTNSIKKIRISLFPYVPSPKATEEIVRNLWKQKHPEIELEFDNPKNRWDCYSQDPPAELDVFEFDAIFLEYFVRNNFIYPINRDNIDNIDDFTEFSLAGSMVNGILYGIPRLACTPVIFYRKGDIALEKAPGLQDIFKVIGPRKDQDIRPPHDKGLLIDLSGASTCACLYLDAVADLNENFSVLPDLPPKEDLDKRAIGNLKLLTRMAGRRQALFVEKEGEFKRAQWFGLGYGRALVSYSERLSAIPVERHQEIAIRSLPLSSKNAVNYFFVDIIAINPLLHGDRRKLAIELANLVASKDVVLACLLVRKEETNSPQYLLPVRNSVLLDSLLLEKAPLYKYLSALISDNPRPFRIGERSRAWLQATKKAIQKEVTGAK